MAKMVVDRLVEREARDAPCRTAEIPLGQAIAADELSSVESVSEPARAALASRYGYGAHEVLALISDREELAQPIVPGLPDLMAEVVIAARREQARSVGDVLLRRTRLGLLAARELLGDGDELTPAVGRVADVLAGELGWSRERTAIETTRFLEEARLEGILVAND
jgi:glycerol-3-phosphate dehydrogenase